MSCKPDPYSLQRRIDRFFRDNPDEELTGDDIVVKFGCSEAAAQKAISRLRTAGVPILTVMTKTYRLGKVHRS